MDALYFYRHSRFKDVEIFFSLRSIAAHAPWVRKVWIFGDRPRFLTDDTSAVEVVPHGYVARVGDFRTPVTNFFLMFYLSSLIPTLCDEYLWFCDDFLLLDDLSEEQARENRYLEDLADVKNRGRGLWKESLWRTYDLLKRLGYTGYNFETHTPTYFTKKRVLEAYCEFKDFVTEDRWYGMLGPTAILNHAYKVEPGMQLTCIRDTNARAGFHGAHPASEEVERQCQGKKFLNFDDGAFCPALLEFLKRRYPTPSKYEAPAPSTPGESPQGESRAPATEPGERTSGPSGGRDGFPPVIMPNRDAFPDLLNREGLLGEGVEIGTLRGDYAVKLLQRWRGARLHCVDPWREATDASDYVDINNVPQAEHEGNFETATRRLSAFEHRCRIHRATSCEAAATFADRSLDFVYLDARHYRAAVLEDLDLWAPKVRLGGYLAGHDYLDGVLPSGKFEVKSAVDEWAAAHGYQVVCSGEHVWRSWFIRVTRPADRQRSTPAAHTA